MKYFIHVISKDHAAAGQAGGFIQASQDKAASLSPLSRGDVVFTYSPGTRFRAGDLLQAFTAAARVTGEAPFQVGIGPRVHAWRLATASLQGHEAPIAPLLPQLTFIEDPAQWSASFPRGLFEIGEDDARRIAEAMGTSVAMATT